jgi:hypothetical protein
VAGDTRQDKIRKDMIHEGYAFGGTWGERFRRSHRREDAAREKVLGAYAHSSANTMSIGSRNISFASLKKWS